MFVRDQFRPVGRDFRRALRQRTPDAVCCRSTAKQDRLVPLAAMAAAERWIDGRHDLVSLPGVGHLPHEEIRRGHPGATEVARGVVNLSRAIPRAQPSLSAPHFVPDRRVAL